MKTSLRLLVLGSLLVFPGVARAQRPAPVITPPSVPQDVSVSTDDFVPFLVGHAVGTQGYVCIANGTTYSWAPFGPHATLYDADGGQIITHFLDPTPYSLVPNPTWQHSKDSSEVWAQKIGESSDAAYVNANSISWLLLEALVVGQGPTGGEKLMAVRRIQRVNTINGKAPTTGCSQPSHVGTRALEPYEADYYFWKDKPTPPFRD